MSYIRTQEIKDKQSQKMKLVHFFGNIDYKKAEEKKKLTVLMNGSIRGRPAGDKGNYKGKVRFSKICVVCNKEFSVVKSRLEIARTCSNNCRRIDPKIIESLKTMDRSYMTTEEYKNKKRDPNLPPYKRYSYEVRKLTEENYLKNINILNPNNLQRTLCGIEGGYQLDHIMSVKKCYNNKISVEEAASVSNLILISWEENLKKRTFERIENFKI